MQFWLVCQHNASLPKHALSIQATARHFVAVPPPPELRANKGKNTAGTRNLRILAVSRALLRLYTTPDLALWADTISLRCCPPIVPWFPSPLPLRALSPKLTTTWYHRVILIRFVSVLQYTQSIMNPQPRGPLFCPAALPPLLGI